MAHSNRKTSKRKRNTVAPPKPYKTFPLSAHPRGRWCKQINGKHYYFGRWGKMVDGKMQRLPGPTHVEAKAEYEAKLDELHNRTVKLPTHDLTVADLCNAYLTAKHDDLEAGEIGKRHWKDLESAARMLCEGLGKTTIVSQLGPDDFAKLRKTYNGLAPNTVSQRIIKVRAIFDYGFANKLIGEVDYGTRYRPPSSKTKRKHDNEKEELLFTRQEILTILEAARLPIKVATLLGVNCGYGSTDIGELKFKHLDLDNGWATYPRPKTGEKRRCWLWPQTVEALREYLETRPEPASKNDIVLVTSNMTSLGARFEESKTDNLGQQFSRLLTKLKINGRNKLGFYTLRRTFRTQADGALDTPALNLIMGHYDRSMGARYLQRIDDERIKRASRYVWEWLYAICYEEDK